jgi:hypothetical protein
MAAKRAAIITAVAREQNQLQTHALWQLFFSRYRKSILQML